ncbi:hypothetical protein, partial [Acidisphaera rubrifaciens]|uniref:hypothetical protein n=1 Tax=Acidisphaera rubrifaciens TaxID=50715 RepID=UPI000662931E
LLAAAGDAPPLVPKRDADVVYDLPTGRPGPGGVLPQERLRWDAARQRMRVDPPGGGIYMITDYATHRIAVVKAADRTVIDAAAPAASLAGPPAAPYRREGTDTVAGAGCTDWATADTEGHDVVICATPEGVVLRVRREGRVVLTARRVSFAPADETVFRVPANYRHIEATQPAGRP